jgi:hypothetical protein
MKNLVVRYISLNRNAGQKTLIMLNCLIMELLPFVHAYTLNFVRDITLKLQEDSTSNIIRR